MQNAVVTKPAEATPALSAGYTPAQFAKIISYHAESVRRCIREGRIAAKSYGRGWRIPPDEAQRILANGLPALSKN